MTTYVIKIPKTQQQCCRFLAGYRWRADVVSRPPQSLGASEPKRLHTTRCVMRIHVQVSSRYWCKLSRPIFTSLHSGQDEVVAVFAVGCAVGKLSRRVLSKSDLVPFFVQSKAYHALRLWRNRLWNPSTHIPAGCKSRADCGIHDASLCDVYPLLGEGGACCHPK